MMHQATKVNGGLLCGAVQYDAEACRQGKVFRALARGHAASGYLHDTPNRIAAWRQDVEDTLRLVSGPK